MKSIKKLTINNILLCLSSLTLVDTKKKLTLVNTLLGLCIGLGLMYAFFLIINHYKKSHKEYVIIKGKDAIATIVPLTYDTHFAYYEVNKKKYKTYKFQNIHVRMRSGEKFLMKYLENNPHDYVILYDVPIINSLQFYKTTSISLEFKKPFMGKKHIEFAYIIGDSVYTRQQKVHDTLIVKYEKIKKEKYKVLYKKDDYDIAYLIFE